MGAVDGINIKQEEEFQMIALMRLLDDDLMKLVFDRNIEATSYCWASFCNRTT